MDMDTDDALAPPSHTEGPTGWALALVREARVGHLATTSASGEPHVIPICFVLHDGALHIAIDQKPKSGRRLLRLRNVEATGHAALVVDRYDEDWTRLAWVLARGRARVTPVSDPVLDALRDKYPQYRAMDLAGRESIELRVERWSWWRGDGIS
jgi:PPOX class probable F420-dependent enzyme